MKTTMSNNNLIFYFFALKCFIFHSITEHIQEIARLSDFGFISIFICSGTVQGNQL